MIYLKYIFFYSIFNRVFRWIHTSYFNLTVNRHSVFEIRSVSFLKFEIRFRFFFFWHSPTLVGSTSWIYKWRHHGDFRISTHELRHISFKPQFRVVFGPPFWIDFATLIHYISACGWRWDGTLPSHYIRKPRPNLPSLGMNAKEWEVTKGRSRVCR